MVNCRIKLWLIKGIWLGSENRDKIGIGLGLGYEHRTGIWIEIG